MAMLTDADVFGLPSAPAGPPRSTFQVPPEVQAERDVERRRILEREAADPRYGADTQAAIRRELGRMPAGTQPTYLSDTDVFGEAPVTPASQPSAARRLGLEAARNVASVGEMVLGVPAQALSVMADISSRIDSLARGRGSKEAAQLAAAERDRILQTYSPRFLTDLVNQMTPKGEAPSPSQVERGMGALMDLVDRDAKAVEERTGGVLKKEDVTSLVNEGLALFGIKAPLAARKAVKPEGLRFEIPTEANPPPNVPAKPAATRVNIFDASTINQALSVKPAKQRAAESKARREQARGAFKEDPDFADYLAFKAEERATQSKAYEEQLAARRMEVEAAREAEGRIGAGVGGPKGRLEEGQVLGEKQPPIATANTAIEIPKRATLDDALEKVKQGREFELTAAEKVALRGVSSSFNRPRIVVPASQRGAVDVEALQPGKGSGLTFEELAVAGKMALGSLLQRSDYTLKTLDRLPQNRSEFPKQMVEEQLRRQDVTAAEKEVLQAVLTRAPGDTISAAQLMKGFKEQTGNFELKPQETGQYAEYGLESIGRDAFEDGAPYADAEGVSATELFPSKDLRPVTRVYQLPEHMQVSDANHFSDPRYFGHTRSFTEDGVRHVVEVQSDLAQKAKGGAKPEEVQGLMQELQTQQGIAAGLRQELGERPLNSMPREFQQRVNAAELRARELTNKLEATAVDSQLSPMLKNWPKRLVREELAQAAAAGEQTVRFATADTVAKVEGWPKQPVYKEGAATEIPALKNVRTPGNALGKVTDFISNGRVFVQDGVPYKAGSWVDINRRPLEAGRVKIDPSTLQAVDLAPLVERETFRPEHQGIYDRYRRDTEKFLNQLGGRPYIDAQGHTWVEVPTGKKGPTQMFGGADPELLRTLGVAGAGAVAGSLLADEETGNAILSGGLGAAAGLGLARGGKALVRGADYGLGALSTRIKNISEPLAHRAREYERRVLGDTHAAISRVDPFLVSLQRLPEAKRQRLSRAILTNDAAQINNLIQSYPELRAGWKEVRQVLDETGAKLQQHNRLARLREDYFPRVVTDYEGLSKALGQEARNTLERRLFEADKASIKATGQGLSGLERSKIVNQHMRGLAASDYAPSFAKGRRIDEVTEALQPFYASPSESLHTYLSAATRDVEKAKFFGRDVARDPKTGKVNLDASIGNLVQREMAAGKLTGKQADDLASMLRSRFGPGERTSSPVIQDIKNWMNAGLLGNVFSAATQLGDVGTTVYTQGMRPTLEAVARRLTGKQRVSAKDFGLTDHISEEFVNTRSSAKFLNTAFKLSGFSTIDLFGKDVLLNAALSKAQRQAVTPRGQRALQEKYGAAFERDFPQLLADLQGGRMTDNVKAYLFSELSHVQPISKLEMPQAYLDMPNGRIVYMLKTFMLKQADIVRRDAYSEIRKGNRAKGLYNLARFGLVLGTAGATTSMLKDWMMGREVNFEAADIADNLLKTFGWSEYVLDKARQGKPVEAIGGAVLPPYQMIDRIISQDPRAVQYIPVVGKPFYYLGTEDAQLREERRQERKASRE